MEVTSLTLHTAGNDPADDLTAEEHEHDGRA
jgi:hypothetical protein